MSTGYVKNVLTLTGLIIPDMVVLSSIEKLGSRPSVCWMRVIEVIPLSTTENAAVCPDD